MNRKTTPAVEDEAFVARLRTGDREALALLVGEYHHRLLATARTLLDEGEAEEAVQDAWLAAWKALPLFRGHSKLSTWLTRIVINEAKMRLRKAGREVRLDATPQEEEALLHRFRNDGHWQPPPHNWHAHSPDDLLMSDELSDCLDKTMGELPENQRLVLELRDVQGLGFEEICNALDISASNVRVLLHRARTKLFGHVDHYQETGEC